MQATPICPTDQLLCVAGLALTRQFTYTDRTVCLIEHERAKYVGTLNAVAPAHQACPVHHPHWKKGGCTAMMPTNFGAGLPCLLDREGERY
jgi:hypothetical protein